MSKPKFTVLDTKKEENGDLYIYGWFDKQDDEPFNVEKLKWYILVPVEDCE